MTGPQFHQPDLFQPTARIGDPATSHAAGALASKRAPNNRERALMAFLKYGALTDFELADITGIAQTSIGVRRGELCKTGLVESVVGCTRPAPSGAQAQVWTLTLAGRLAAWS